MRLHIEFLVILKEDVRAYLAWGWTLALWDLPEEFGQIVVFQLIVPIREYHPMLTLEIVDISLHFPNMV